MGVDRGNMGIQLGIPTPYPTQRMGFHVAASAYRINCEVDS